MRPLSTRSGRVSLAWPDRAFTLVELLVVLFLSALFGIMVAEAVNGATGSAQTMIGQATARTRAHDTMNDVVRALRGARPLGACLDKATAYDAPLSVCQQPGEYPAHPAGVDSSTPLPIEEATASRLVFYANDTTEGFALAGTPGCATPTAGSALWVPDRVIVEVNTSGHLTVRRWCAPAGATYTDAHTFYSNPSINTATPRVAYDAGPVTSPNVFTFYDKCGQQLTPGVNGLTPTQRAAVATVEVSPTFTGGHGLHTVTYAADEVVALSIGDPNEGTPDATTC